MAARRPVEGSPATSRRPASRRSRALIPGQVLGYWFETLDEIPKARPAYDPTGAVLPHPGEHLESGAICLDLVQVDGGWFVLSEAAVYTYRHSARLAHGKTCYFVPADPWGTALPVRFDARLSRSELHRIYGPAAAARARSDFPALQVRLAPVPA